MVKTHDIHRTGKGKSLHLGRKYDAYLTDSFDKISLLLMYLLFLQRLQTVQLWQQ